MTGVKRPGTAEPGSAQGQSTSGQAPELDQTSAGEVRTKLELARQFLDMGDPESARHMLDEVLTEGDAAQKEEAQQLIETLP